MIAYAAKWQVIVGMYRMRPTRHLIDGPSPPAGYNIGPAQLLLVIATGSGKPDGQEMKWGIVPFRD